MFKRIALLTIAAITLTGCPSASTSQKAALASQNAAVIVQGLETAEIAAHQQGLIPDEDHKFIQTEVLALAQVGKTVDSCIRTAGTSEGSVSCISTAIAAVDEMQSNGALQLKSTQAKQDFSIAISGVRAVLVSVQTVVSTK